MIRKVEIRRYRSLEDVSLPIGNIRILIGPNAAGKSNLIDALRLLAEAVRSDMETAVTRRGGLKGVVFFGSDRQRFQITLEYFVPDPSAPTSRSDMHYTVAVEEREGRPAVALEELLVKRARGTAGAPKRWFKAEWGMGDALRADPGKRLPPTSMVGEAPPDQGEGDRPEAFKTGDPGVLALKALGFLDTYPRIRALRTFIEGWQFLTIDLAKIREPRRDERATVLATDAGNLGNVLRTLHATDPSRHDAILSDVRSLLDHVRDVSTDVERGRVTLLMHENAFKAPLEAISLSDGTLRLLAIVTALETMPEHGLLCVEEPEHGLHPLVFGPLLDLVRERCPKNGTKQVLMTTHSPDLVDAATVDEIVPVERDSRGATVFRRLDPQKIKQWLNDFRLGELWRMRQIGGVPQ
jgi:predicted ATPase